MTDNPWDDLNGSSKNKSSADEKSVGDFLSFSNKEKRSLTSSKSKDDVKDHSNSKGSWDNGSNKRFSVKHLLILE